MICDLRGEEGETVHGVIEKNIGCENMTQLECVQSHHRLFRFRFQLIVQSLEKRLVRGCEKFLSVLA